MITRFARIVCGVAAAGLLTASVLYSQTWLPQIPSGTSEFSAVSFVNDEVGYMSGAYGVICRTTNGGAVWERRSAGTSSHFSDQYFIDASTGWVVGQNGIIKKTTDGGTTWSQQSSGTTSWLNAVCFDDAQTGWVLGANGTVKKTTNGGATWTAQSSGTTSTIEGAWFTSSSSGFATCANGSILKTQNGGTSWSSMQSNTTQALNSVCFVGTSVGWVVGNNGKIMKTTNGGSTWFDLSSGTSVHLNAVSFSSLDTGWAAGNQGTIIMTTNGGSTWFDQASTTTENLRSIFAVSGEHAYAVGLSSVILEYATVHALPVSLASFTAVAVDHSTVQLNWRTISEVNNYGFEIERAVGSPSGFELLSGSFVAGHGTTNEPRSYTYTDYAAMAGRVYYRLKQTDLDGTVRHTDPIAVDVATSVDNNAVPASFALKQNFPNPFNPSTKIEFSIPTTGLVSLKVFDVLGREVATIVDEQLSQGNHTRTFSGEGLSSGVYWYRLTTGQLSETKKFVLSK